MDVTTKLDSQYRPAALQDATHLSAQAEDCVSAAILKIKLQNPLCCSEPPHDCHSALQVEKYAIERLYLVIKG